MRRGAGPWLRERQQRRKVLEYGLSDLAAADRETVEQRIAEGQSAADAEAEFLTDDHFEAWYQDICSQLKQYEG